MQFNGVRRSEIWLAGALILGAFATYQNSLDVPFFFDDPLAILENPTIRHLADIGAVLSPTLGGAAGRPVVNLSLAVNYALGGTAVKGYHLTNVLLHATASLALFGCLRRTLLRGQGASRFSGHAVPLAFASAALWLLHPLQTESVTCVIQRTELLVSVFYTLTLYCFIRAAETSSKKWATLAVGCCGLGMASKEVMVSAPLIIFLYDRTFLAGSFRQAWQRRRPLHLGMAATWLVLLFLLVRQGGTRGEAAGFGLGVSGWAYGLKQCEAIVHYLRLVVWPHPLIVFYGTDVITNPAEVWPQALALFALLAATAYAVWRRPALGFLGAFFFAILAPSSSVVPLVSQTVAEHRMHLSLAAPLILGMVALHGQIGLKAIVAGIAAAVALALASARRNVDYRSELAIWNDTVAKAPNNARARVNLGSALQRVGQPDAARAQFEAALRLDPLRPEALNNLATLFIESGRPALAIEPCRAALRLRPDFALAYNNLGSALVQTGRVAEGIASLQTALKLRPEFPEAHCNLASALLQNGDVDRAIAHGQAAVALRSNFALAHFNLATAFLRQNRSDLAIAALEAAVRADPSSADAQSNLGGLLYQRGDPAQAIVHFEAALRARPEHLGARNNLASALAQLGRIDEAVAQYRRVIAADPNYAEAHANLGLVLARAGRAAEAIPALETALQLRPDDASLRNALDRLRSGK